VAQKPALPMQTGTMHDLGVRRDRLTLLLIDDDLVSREVTATVLTMNSFLVHTADHGAAALEMLAAGTAMPDVILLDAQMPGLHGAALIAELRKGSRARIIVVSGSDPSPDIAAAADGFLLKPLEVETLRALLEGQKVKLPAPSALGADAPVVSAETLAQLRALMPDSAVREIFEAIVADLAKRAQVLEGAIANENWAEVRRTGHAIKGGCAMAGALQAARLGALLEALPDEASGNQSDNSLNLLSDLRSAAGALQSMLDAELPA
jgi:CheY-like chemotaxis protein